jgi:hypothetical protein
LFASALSSTEFQWDLRTISASRLVIFMDACYSAGVTQGGARDVGIVENPFTRLAEGRGRLVIASAQPNQRSWEDPKVGHGIFTHHLLEALKGKADQEGDGYVSILEVYKYLEREVPRSVRTLANSVQEPLMRGDLSQDIVLTADIHRIEELKRHSDEAARRHREELQEKQRKLLELYVNRELARDAYLQALELVEKEPGEISSQEEQTLVDNLEAMLKGGISPRVYLANRASIFSEREKSAGPRSPNVPPENLPIGTDRSTPTATGAAETTQSAVKYCFSCGTPINPQNKFCNGCGRQLRP